MSKFFRLLWVAVAMTIVPTAHAARDVAMVTVVQGKIRHSAPGGEQLLQAFVKLKADDTLSLDNGARMEIIYFENGQQESWGGTGTLKITATEGRATGLPPPVVKKLPLIIVKQMARTPSLDSQGRAGVVRLRSIPTAAAIEKIDETYNKMRAETDKDDINPELYLLAGMFETRQLDRVERTLAALKEAHPDKTEVKVLASLYGRALKEARRLDAKPAE